MCEWLSCSEWCDVQLQCGGRTFSAHRAVLASVSTFLRKILLSCPLEESPTFIVLPDFDIEAMSSVLYYIYNGEVIIEKQKLEMFLDITKAMQIFIDNQYLPACNSVDNTDMFSNMHKQSKINNVFSLGTINCEEQYVNLNRRERIHETFSQHSHSCTDFRDKQVKCRSEDWRDQFKPSLGNLQSPNADRQRNSFLRDLFMETYPRNGNANGRSAGVLAISNERYRTPTSVFLTNANGKHPRVDNTLVEAKNIFDHKSCLSTVHPLAQLDCISASDEHTCSKSIANLSMSRTNINYLPNPNQLFGSLVDLKDKYVPSLDLSITESILTSSSKMAESVNQYFLAAQRPLIHSFSANHCKDDNKNVKNSYLKRSNLVKGAILNQVLDSPWCPRLPRDYRPFRRKIQSASNLSNIVKEKNVNDSNNNIQTLTLTPSPDILVPLDKDPTAEESKVQPTTYSIASLVADNDYTCTICNQVFTSSTTLSTHMRRHSSTRYTCTECSKSFSQLRNFKYHMSVHRGTKEFAATCTVCGKYFNDRGYLSSHMKIHRNRKEYKCSQCPKSFNQRVAYNMHVRIHTGVKPHVCAECGKAFSRKMLLKQHQRTHSGEKPYACPHCDKRFADRSNMTLHLRLHTGIKPFSCSLCPKSFTKKHHLKSHLNFHTGAKPYSCPRCKLAFTQSSNMRTHLKKCSAPAPNDYTGISDS